MDNRKPARRPVLRIVGGALLVSILVVAALVLVPGGDQPIGEISPQARQSRLETPTATDKQVLFGDLHVQTTYSMDAFFTPLPLLGGQGTHPPADACDFARHCAALDFYSITDHAQEPHLPEEARKRLMREIGIPAYWRKHGFPPQCRPLGSDDFECD